VGVTGGNTLVTYRHTTARPLVSLRKCSLNYGNLCWWLWYLSYFPRLLDVYKQSSGVRSLFLLLFSYTPKLYCFQTFPNSITLHFVMASKTEKSSSHKRSSRHSGDLKKSSSHKHSTSYDEEPIQAAATYTYYWYCPWCHSGIAHSRDTFACLNGSCGTMRPYDNETAVRWEMHEDPR
jgi:hypothetical protein